jgi:hypothetical protein
LEDETIDSKKEGEKYGIYNETYIKLEKTNIPFINRTLKEIEEANKLKEKLPLYLSEVLSFYTDEWKMLNRLSPLFRMKAVKTEEETKETLIKNNNVLLTARGTKTTTQQQKKRFFQKLISLKKEDTIALKESVRRDGSNTPSLEDTKETETDEDKEVLEELLKTITPAQLTEIENELKTSFPISYEHEEGYSFSANDRLISLVNNTMRWRNISEKLCFRKTNLSLPKKESYKFLLKFNGFNFTTKINESLFCKISIFNITTKEKLTEDYNFHLHTNVFDKSEEKDEVQQIDEYIKETQVNRSEKECLFTLTFNHEVNMEDIYVLFQVDRIFLSTSVDDAVKPYTKILSKKEKIQYFHLYKNSESYSYFRQPIMFGLQKIFENDKLKEGEVLFPFLYKVITGFKLLDCFGLKKEEMDKKFKQVDVSVKFEIIKVTDENNYFPKSYSYQIDELNSSIKGKVKYSEELTDPILPFLNFRNHLYLYPDTLTLKKGKNIGFRVLFKTKDDDIVDGEERIVSRFDSNMRLKFDLSTVNYNDKKPRFNDEFIIDLPLVLDEDQFVLFVFYDIKDNGESTNKNEEPLLGKIDKSILGYSILPIMNQDYINLETNHELDIFKTFKTAYSNLKNKNEKNLNNLILKGILFYKFKRYLLIF